MGRFTNTWSLMKSSWQVLKTDKSLMIFPVISGICSMFVLASFVLPIVLTSDWTGQQGAIGGIKEAIYLGVLFSFYFCNYFIVAFFNSALVHCAARRLKGDDTSVMEGVRAALSCAHLIFGWVLLAATVGLLLHILEERLGKIGKIIISLIGMAWSSVSFLVIPVLVLERRGPIEALKESASLFKRSWGDQFRSNFSFGLITILFCLPAILLFVLGAMTGNVFIIIACAIVDVIFFLAVSVVTNALRGIFQVALYMFVRHAQVANGFNQEALARSVSSR